VENGFNKEAMFFVKRHKTQYAFLSDWYLHRTKFPSTSTSLQAFELVHAGANLSAYIWGKAYPEIPIGQRTGNGKLIHSCWGEHLSDGEQ
jgi:hypothetical protein